MTDSASPYGTFRTVPAEGWEPFRLLTNWDISGESREVQQQQLEDEARIFDLMVNYPRVARRQGPRLDDVGFQRR